MSKMLLEYLLLGILVHEAFAYLGYICNAHKLETFVLGVLLMCENSNLLTFYSIVQK